MLQSPHNHLYYLNGFFDLYLGDYPVEKLARTASEMSVLFLFMGNENDSILLDVTLPDQYLEYLESLCIKCLKPFKEKRDGISKIKGIPWGWEKNSFERLTCAGATCDSPDLAVVKNVNSRKFHNLISERLGIGVSRTVYFDSCNSYLDHLNSIDNFPVVVKPSFSGSGFGFKFIRNKDDGKNIIKDIEYLMNHGGITVEPWCTRIHDFSSSININNNGNLSPIRHQRSFSSKYGTFVGIYISPSDPVIMKYQRIQESAVINTAIELHKQGYFGPAGFDSFSYVDRYGNEKVAPVIEINARHSMSDVAHALRNRYAPDKFCFFRMMSKKNCILPSTYERWISLIRDDHFNPDIKEGIILVTPLRLNNGKHLVQPLKNAFFISANSEKELFEKDERLRNLVAK